ncbi:MAG: deoxynucleoside kinase [Gammaproteobacteria bacterium]|nr:deoxynucleoside kinase [Gammaproteobacteria bacterium]
MTIKQPDYIVVEGPIGVGKTTLARRLSSSFGSALLLESGDANPFLEKFYNNPKDAALPTQLFFLFQRAKQMQELRQGDMFRPVRVADYLMAKDQLFAGLTLDDEEYKLYEQVYSQLTLDSPTPDLVIYLQAPVNVLLKRIRKRGISYERKMGKDYLSRLVDTYERFFHTYSAGPLLIVNSTDIDIAGNQMDYDALLERVRSTTSGRHYFNPAPANL